MTHVAAAHHVEFALYVVLLLFLVYFPPKHYAGFGTFLERHFGDAVGFYILYLGVALVIVGDVWSNLHSIEQVGHSFIYAGIIALKLRTSPANGNENGAAKS